MRPVLQNRKFNWCKNLNYTETDLFSLKVYVMGENYHFRKYQHAKKQEKWRKIHNINIISFGKAVSKIYQKYFASYSVNVIMDNLRFYTISAYMCGFFRKQNEKIYIYYNSIPKNVKKAMRYFGKIGWIWKLEQKILWKLFIGCCVRRRYVQVFTGIRLVLFCYYLFFYIVHCS